MRDFVPPRDTQESVIEAFRQVHLILRSLDVPILTSLQSVRGIAEGTSAYFQRDDGILCRYSKIGGELYCEEIPKA